MEYVVARWEPDQRGYWLDASAYELVLPDLAAALPPGARAFALDPDHYDFYSDRCVKDLWFSSFQLDDAEGSARLAFRPNDSKHPEGLQIVYSGVTSVSIDRDHAPRVGWLGSVLLDELRPSPGGVIHEFVTTSGSLQVVAGDLEATWGRGKELA